MISRRILGTVVLAAYLSGQWMAMPHAHANDGAVANSGHGSRPHVHASWFRHKDHSHGHGYERTHHHHDDHARVPIAPAFESDHDAPNGHDSDAVYLPDELGASTISASNVV